MSRLEARPAPRLRRIGGEYPGAPPLARPTYNRPQRCTIRSKGGPATVPTYDKFIEPILRYLASRPQGAVARETQSEAQSSMTDDVTVL